MNYILHFGILLLQMAEKQIENCFYTYIYCCTIENHFH